MNREERTNKQRRILSPAEKADGFAAVMRRLRASSPDERARLRETAQAAEAGHAAYAIGHEYLDRGRYEDARRWLRMAVRLGAPGAEKTLEEIALRSTVDDLADVPLAGGCDESADLMSALVVSSSISARCPTGLSLQATRQEWATILEEVEGKPPAAARQDADRLIEEARQEAETIISDAKAEAEAVVDEAQAEAQRLVRAARSHRARVLRGGQRDAAQPRALPAHNTCADPLAALDASDPVTALLRLTELMRQAVIEAQAGSHCVGDTGAGWPATRGQHAPPLAPATPWGRRLTRDDAQPSAGVQAEARHYWTVATGPRIMVYPPLQGEYVEYLGAGGCDVALVAVRTGASGHPSEASSTPQAHEEEVVLQVLDYDAFSLPAGLVIGRTVGAVGREHPQETEGAENSARG
ncbi:hypothetical protein [Streptomyces chartreusis]|uniref:hypothetical protein n=1 Tax=Streptomyces chartreusis TaxID=1969 RepID=UPI00365218DF